jgi:spermidine synthase
MASYFQESQPWGFSQYEIVKESHTSFKTKIQQVDFITNPHFGRMLFLDGVLQSTTTDEHIYHDALVRAGMRSTSRNILIAGGCEGAVAREIFEWPSVYSVRMVDWDEELVNHCILKEKFNVSAFADSRLTYIPKNILDFCKESKTLFDTVFVDLLDLTEDSDLATMKEIIEALSLTCVRGGCVVVVNVGRVRAYAEKLVAGLVESAILEVSVPSFQEVWYIVKFQI